MFFEQIFNFDIHLKFFWQLWMFFSLLSNYFHRQIILFMCRPFIRHIDHSRFTSLQVFSPQYTQFLFFRILFFTMNLIRSKWSNLSLFPCLIPLKHSRYIVQLLSLGMWKQICECTHMSNPLPLIRSKMFQTFLLHSPTPVSFIQQSILHSSYAHH